MKLNNRLISLGNLCSSMRIDRHLDNDTSIYANSTISKSTSKV